MKRLIDPTSREENWIYSHLATAHRTIAIDQDNKVGVVVSQDVPNESRSIFYILWSNGKPSTVSSSFISLYDEFKSTVKFYEI